MSPDAIPLLAGLDAAAAADFLALGEPVDFAAGERILGRDNPSHDLFILLDGKAVVSVGRPEIAAFAGRPQEVGTFRGGDVFGEVAFLKGLRRSADLAAITAIKALRFERERTMAFLEGTPGFGLAFYRRLGEILADRLVTTTLLWRDR